MQRSAHTREPRASQHMQIFDPTCLHILWVLGEGRGGSRAAALDKLFSGHKEQTDSLGAR